MSFCASRSRPWLLLTTLLLSLSSICYAQAPACALNLPVADVTKIVGSSDPQQAKVKELVLLAESHSTPAWAALPRNKDLAQILSDVISGILTKQKDAAQIGTAISAAYVAGCKAPASSEAVDMKSTVFAAAGVSVNSVSTSMPKPTVATKRRNGDRLQFLTDKVQVFSQGDDTPKRTAPCKSKFFVTGTDSTGDNVFGFFKAIPGQVTDTPAKKGSPGQTCSPDSPGDLVEPRSTYEVSQSDLVDAVSISWDFGVLVAPYKFHFSDHSTSPSATVGGYFGKQIGNPAISIEPIISGGLGVVPVSSSTSGTSGQSSSGGSTTHAALSAATGTIFTIKQAGGFQVGLLLGIDWAGKGAEYRYEGKPWLAISFGTALTKSQ